MMTDAVLWTSASRFHDWRNGEFPRTLLLRWLEVGMIGVPEWFEQEEVTKTLQPVHPDCVPDLLLALSPDKNNSLNFRCGGTSPHKWWLSVMCSPFDPALGRVIGYGMINLRFPRGGFSGPSRSAPLLDVCESAYSPDNCEYSAIHPLGHMDQLKLHHYGNALVLGPMMAGIFWAQFLGPGHIEKFPKDALDGLPVARKRWYNSRGLFLAVTDDLTTADTPETEQQLIKLTGQLRASQTGGSRN